MAISEFVTRVEFSYCDLLLVLNPLLFDRVM